MAYDIYGRVANGLKRMAVPAGTALPHGTNPEDWRKLGTMDQIWPTLEEKIKRHGYGEYESTIKITGPS